MSIAIIITGTMCSGKTTISEKMQKKINIELITELNVSPNSIHGMINEIKSKENKDIVLIEHAEILRVIDKIDKCFTKIVIIFMNVSDNLLIENFNKRKSQNTIGNYLLETVLEWKKYIEEDFKKLQKDYIKYTVDINTNEDYDIAYNKMMNFLSMQIDK